MMNTYVCYIYIYIGRKKQVAGLAYVAIFRVRKTSDLVIEPTTFDRNYRRNNYKTINFRNKIETGSQTDQHYNEILKNYSYLIQ